MTPEQQAAYIFSQTACMQVELAAMQAANMAAESDPGCLALPHAPDDFRALPLRYGVHHNAIVGWFTS
jgi:hypothetical protein